MIVQLYLLIGYSTNLGPAPLPLLAAEPWPLAPGPRAEAEQLAQLELDDHCVCC